MMTRAKLNWNTQEALQEFYLLAVHSKVHNLDDYTREAVTLYVLIALHHNTPKKAHKVASEFGMDAGTIAAGHVSLVSA